MADLRGEVTERWLCARRTVKGDPETLERRLTTDIVTLLQMATDSDVEPGLGSLWGTLLGGVVLGVAQGVGSAVDPAYGILAGHLVFLPVLATRPAGVGGRGTGGCWIVSEAAHAVAGYAPSWFR